MKEDSLKDYFEQLYNRNSWFKLLKNNESSYLSTKQFQICHKLLDGFVHVKREALKIKVKNERYTVTDLMFHENENIKIYYKIVTSEYRNIQDAHDGFFYSLWGAEKLDSREEGALTVGDISFGSHKYICFVRNNVCIRIMAMGNIQNNLLFNEVAKNIDGQIIQQSV